MNNFSTIGHIGSDAEVRLTKSGKALTSFSVAVKSGWGQNEKTTWVNCTLWGKGSDPHGLTPHLLKGKQVGVSGEIYLEEWEGQDGNKRYTLKCNVRDVTLCGHREEAPQPSQDHAQPRTDDFTNDDVPF